MFVQRLSMQARRNPALEDVSQTRPKGGNAALVKAARIDTGVLLLGGTAVPHFRLRVAQGALRGDLLPSYWSLAAVLLDGEHVFSIPIDCTDGRASVPETNAIQLFDPARFDDTDRYPNVALIAFPGDAAALREAIARLQLQRTQHGFPDALWHWLGHAWGVQGADSPIARGIGLPCARFVAQAYAAIGIELLPGVAMGGACPEALWNSALWWSQTYRDEAGEALPVRGIYRVLQPAAAALGFKDRLVDGSIRPRSAQTSPLAEGLRAAKPKRGRKR